jgi:hypothetical protein
MLLTTLDEYDKDSAGGGGGTVEMKRSFGGHLDRCHLMTNETALFIGFADEPGPTRLQVRDAGNQADKWRTVEPDRRRCRTMYRFLIPTRQIQTAEEEAR